MIINLPVNIMDTRAEELILTDEYNLLFVLPNKPACTKVMFEIVQLSYGSEWYYFYVYANVHLWAPPPNHPSLPGD